MARPTSATARLRAALRPSLDSMVRVLSTSSRVAHVASHLRNRMESVVALHLGLDLNQESNGEAWVVRALAPRIRNFVDVGANIGDWTQMVLEALPAVERGFLFEPAEETANRLRERFVGDHRLEVIQAAASDSVGELEFFEEPDAGRHSSVLGAYARGARAVRVRCTTLDAELETRGAETIDYLKIDAEGHDLSVLRGAVQLLKGGRVAFLQFEYNEAWRLSGSRLSDALALLEGCDFDVFLLKSNALWTFPYDTYGEYYRYSNFVGVHRGTHIPTSMVRGRA